MLLFKSVRVVARQVVALIMFIVARGASRYGDLAGVVLTDEKFFAFVLRRKQVLLVCCTSEIALFDEDLFSIWRQNVIAYNELNFRRYFQLTSFESNKASNLRCIY